MSFKSLVSSFSQTLWKSINDNVNLYAKLDNSFYYVMETGTAHSSGESIKLEPAFIGENEKALLTAGYVRNNSYSPGFAVGRGGGRGRAYDTMRQQGHRQTENNPFKGTSVQRQEGIKKDINPTVSVGKLLTCKPCGSYRHMITDCPHC